MEDNMKVTVQDTRTISVRGKYVSGARYTGTYNSCEVKVHFKNGNSVTATDVEGAITELQAALRELFPERVQAANGVMRV